MSRQARLQSVVDRRKHRSACRGSVADRRTGSPPPETRIPRRTGNQPLRQPRIADTVPCNLIPSPAKLRIRQRFPDYRKHGRATQKQHRTTVGHHHSVSGNVRGDQPGGVEGALEAVAPPLASLAAGVQAHQGELEACEGGLLGREVAAARTARRSRALIDSIAFVVHMMMRISWSNCRRGTNSAQTFSQSLMTAG